MAQKDQAYNSALISELGAKRYVKAMGDLQYSNVNFLYRNQYSTKPWKECNFGCHGNPYRVLKKQSTYSEMLKPIDEASPLIAGIIDGMHHATIQQVENIGGGIKRTGEGLGLTGQKNFQNVGDENYAVYEFAKSTLEKMVNFDLDVIDNPIMQTITVVINEYISLLPEWLIDELYNQNAFKLQDNVDLVWLMRASAIGLIDGVTREDLEKAAKLLNDPTQRLAGKTIGKKLAPAIGAAIAANISKKLIRNSVEVREMKRKLVQLRKIGKKAKGGLAGVLFTLLKSQGFLNKAGEASRRLERACPRLWNILRFKLKGANMVYFVVENLVQEYIDRIELLEKNPKEFAKVMSAFIRDKKTSQIFFPNSSL